MHINWSDYILSAHQQNMSLNDHLLHLFLKNWSTKINYSMYFDKCAPSICTYTTMVNTNVVYAITLLLSLYGGLVLIFRLIAPSVVHVMLKLKHRSRNIRINSGLCSLSWKKSHFISDSYIIYRIFQNTYTQIY